MPAKILLNPRGREAQLSRQLLKELSEDDAMSFLTNYFALRGISLGDRRTTLELGLQQAYERQGITDEIDTHGNGSSDDSRYDGRLRRHGCVTKRVCRTDPSRHSQDPFWLLIVGKRTTLSPERA